MTSFSSRFDQVVYESVIRKTKKIDPQRFMLDNPTRKRRPKNETTYCTFMLLEEVFELRTDTKGAVVSMMIK